MSNRILFAWPTFRCHDPVRIMTCYCFPIFQRSFGTHPQLITTNTTAAYTASPGPAASRFFRTECKGKCLLYSNQISSNYFLQNHPKHSAENQPFLWRTRPPFFKADCKGRDLIFTTKFFFKNIPTSLIIPPPSPEKKSTPLQTYTHSISIIYPQHPVTNSRRTIPFYRSGVQR